MDRKQVAFDERFLTDPSGPEQARLIGTRCRSCGVVTFGRSQNCEHCTSSQVEEIALSTRGKIWSYTVLRYASPPPYQPPEPYVPIPAAWVELPEGVRVISPIRDCQPDQLQVGLEVELVVAKGWEDEAGNEVMSYAFRPIR